MSCRVMSAVAALPLIAAMIPHAAAYVPAVKPRVVVVADIGSDPDDQQSMVRLLLYANAFDIEALVAASTGTTTNPDQVAERIAAYARALPNLRVHAQGWPTAEQLRARIRVGSPTRI